MRSGYEVRPFGPADHHRELMAINASAPTRQGKPMARHYLREDFSLPSSQWQTPYGVFSAEGVLVGYVLVLEQGEVATLGVILGHADHLENGIMYLLVTEIVGDLMRKGQARYCFYDMWFGASDGLRTFKRQCDSIRTLSPGNNGTPCAGIGAHRRVSRVGQLTRWTGQDRAFKVWGVRANKL